MSQMDLKEYAGFFRRFGAMLIDSIFFFTLSTLVQLAFAIPGYISFNVDDGHISMDGGASWLEQLILAAITIVMWVKMFGTPGKLLLDCQVVDAETGKAITWSQAVIRYLGYFVSFIPFGLGFFWIIWDRRRQGFHDKLAKTVVLHEVDHFREDESTKTLEQLIQEVR